MSAPEERKTKVRTKGSRQNIQQFCGYKFIQIRKNAHDKNFCWLFKINEDTYLNPDQ